MKIFPLLLGLSIFLCYNYLGHYLQNSAFYIDGFFIKVIISFCLGLIYYKFLKLDLSIKTIFLSAFVAYAGQAIVTAFSKVSEGDSVAKAITIGVVSEIFTLIAVSVTLILIIKLLPNKFVLQKSIAESD